MPKIRLVLADSDEIYLNNLTNYIFDKISTFEVYSFSTKASMIKFIETNTNKVDIIAFSEDMLDGTISAADIPAKIMMTDNSFPATDEFSYVNKYQKTEKFINDILMIYAEKSGRTEAVTKGDKATKVVGFYSPVGGSGKTTLALSVAVVLAARGCKALYLNGERINSTVGLLNGAGGGNMSDVYLAVKTKGASVGLKLINARCVDDRSGVFFVNPAESSLEINELTNDEFKRMIADIDALGEFDTIIIDFDSEFDRDKISLLSCCDKIIAPFEQGEPARGKMKLFMKELDMYDELREIRSITIPVINKAGKGADDSEIRVGATIPKVPELRNFADVPAKGSELERYVGAVIDLI